MTKGGGMSSIALATPLPVHCGDRITFITTFDGHGNPNLRVEVLAYQNEVLVYGEGGAPGDFFTLGGGGSAWLDNGGGPAHCVANLYYFTHKAGVPSTTYVATCTFEAT